MSITSALGHARTFTIFPVLSALQSQSDYRHTQTNVESNNYITHTSWCPTKNISKGMRLLASSMENSRICDHVPIGNATEVRFKALRLLIRIFFFAT